MSIYVTSAFWFAVFGLFHSLAAQEFFKRFLERSVGAVFVTYYWRLIYCAISYYLLYYLAWSFIVKVDMTPVFVYPLWLLNICALLKIFGFGLHVWACVQLDYFEFWGLKQAYRGITISNATPKQPLRIAGTDRLEQKGAYAFCRHPALTGVFLFIASTPMSAPLLWLLLLFVIYCVIGSHFEERHLVERFGDQYRDYQRNVGAFFPKWRQLRLTKN